MIKTETIVLIGSSLGYIISAITLITMTIKHFRSKASGFIKQESKADAYEQRLQSLENLLNQQIKDDKEFKDKMYEMISHQNHADRQLLANIIETTYYQNKDTKTIDSIALKRITNAYSIYHDEFNGNSYISAIYEEMIEDWEHI